MLLFWRFFYILSLKSIFWEGHMKERYSSKTWDHLGIVSQICDEIGIVEALDKLIPPDQQMKLSHGECVKLMLINGLGFTARPLYLEAQFFPHVLWIDSGRKSVTMRYQLGKSTRTPTMRWIVQLFAGIHLLIHRTRSNVKAIILNMNPIRSHVLRMLGPPFEKIYSNS